MLFRFANIEILWLLWVIPVFIAAYWILTKHKRRQLEQFGDPELVEMLMPNASHVNIGISTGVFLAPNGSVTVTSTSSGWVVSNSFT